jgi:hypothetical protein
MIHFSQGVFCSQFAMSKPMNILESESVEEYDALSASLISEFAPTTETERLLVEMMIQHEWLMRRAIRMQQHLDAAAQSAQPDMKRLKLVVRYYKTHERSYAQAKRELENMRKHKTKMDRALDAEQRQWEQILKKMPTLTNWVN